MATLTHTSIGPKASSTRADRGPVGRPRGGVTGLPPRAGPRRPGRGVRARGGGRGGARAGPAGAPVRGARSRGRGGGAGRAGPRVEEAFGPIGVWVNVAMSAVL